MASTPAHIDAATQQADAATKARLLISLPLLPNGSLDAMLANLAAAFPGQSVLVATPVAVPNGSSPAIPNGIQLLPYTPAVTSATTWVLTAADYLNTFK